MTFFIMVVIYTILISYTILILKVDALQKPNIILILTDDQDILLNSMDAMNNVRERIADKGITFQTAFVNSPICCPSRSSILTGKHIHNIGVKNNSLSGNCSSSEWQRNHEPHTFASLLKSKGSYTTFYAGKYLNMYGDEKSGGLQHVPTGWDWWLGLHGNSRYYNYTLSINGSAKSFTDEYLTDIMKEYALSFLNRQDLRDTPFLIMLSPPASHAPFTPAPRHKEKFPKLKALRTPSFNYSAPYRHWLLRLPPTYLPQDVTVLDNIHKNRLQTLLAVDEMIGEIMKKLEALRVLENTYILFTSDNGFHIGQFVQPWDKRQPYETDIRVPFVIQGPFIKENIISHLPISAVDIAPTILSMAGINVPSDMDGTSFYRDIVQLSKRERNILIEYYGEGDSKSIDASCPLNYDNNVSQCRAENWCKCQDARNNTYACVRRLSSTTNFKFCQFYDSENFIEAYNLQTDPYELHNIYYEMENNQIQDYVTTLNRLKNCIGQTCYL